MSAILCPICKAEYPAEIDRCPVHDADLCESEALERVNTTIGNYEVGEILGCGGMGVVYAGQHRQLGKPVAIKILHQERGNRRESAAEMLREAQAATRIQHPNIVDVTDFGSTEDGAAFFVMEYLRGKNLGRMLARRRLDVDSAKNLASQIASALAAAHSAGIVHRDLKPENVFLIDRNGNSSNNALDFVKVLDFGLAKVVGLGPSSRTRAGMLAGTPTYMSPEQARNLPVDGRTDIYSLGVLLYQMVTGHLPYSGKSALDTLMAHVHAPVPDPRQHLSAIDSATAAIIQRCLQKDPQSRFPTMEVLAAALKGRLPFTDEVELEPDDRSAPVAGSPSSMPSSPTVTSEFSGNVLEPESFTSSPTVSCELEATLQAYHPVSSPPTAPEPRKRRARHVAILAATALGAVTLIAVWPNAEVVRPPQKASAATSSRPANEHAQTLYQGSDNTSAAIDDRASGSHAKVEQENKAPSPVASKPTIRRRRHTRSPRRRPVVNKPPDPLPQKEPTPARLAPAAKKIAKATTRPETAATKKRTKLKYTDWVLDPSW